MSCLFQRTASPHAAADLVFRTFLIYLAWGDEKENAISPTYKEIEDVRKSYEAMVKTYNHELHLKNFQQLILILIHLLS